ncbi:MAG: class I SAM-dependent methyltransferase, partial [Chitinophagaceae bacterium]
MYSAPILAVKYLRYYLTAMNSKGHGMHSPFIYSFIRNVLNDYSRYGVPAEVEHLRYQLRSDRTELIVEDLGAGSRTGATKQRTVAQLARTAVKPCKYGQLLYRLVRHYRPAMVLELGTSLGITTAYLVKGGAGTVHSIEGSSEIHQVARRNLEALGARAQLHQGNFDTVLPALLSRMKQVDLAFVDGNHRYEPTIRYFTQLLEHCGNDSILVFDDIHWSAEMERAWAEIKAHPRVRCTVDLFFLGFVFFRDEFKVPRHFSIRY